ncbi:MAG: cation:proton antiporter [Prevotella sp.]|uniref:cation:proton antiporter n=1 Tax=Prevotella sp. TaxID=59823 RepID=UPI002A29C650|nr:cation:proton antiporter [Prevotella sp.]MDD7318496.1 cation:proton antiporter [Prevotellaceae bacterium]MDY4020301.1 cation:proton antiporter [Prevotella sp.]
MLDFARYFPITDPTQIFFVVLLIILFAPIVMGKLRIPHIIGMVLAGVLLGQYGLNILVRDDSFELFGNVGLYYIMFLAALEMDFEGIKKMRNKLAVFALLSFAVPFAVTYFAATLLLGYQPISALMLSCIMSSNTLIAYPIVSRYGLQGKPSVMLSVGATMITLFLSLVVMAGVASSGDGSGGVLFWLWFFVKIVAVCTFLTFAIPRLTRWFLRRYSDAVMQFIFIMAILFMSAVLTDAAGLEGIFGAFFAGLILNRYIPHLSALMNRIEFIGNAFFIPYFLIGVGMLINVGVLFEGGSIIAVVVAIVFFGTFGKAVAAYLSCCLFKLPWSSGHMMFGLTSAHAAGAIAILLVGMKMEAVPGMRAVDDNMLNGVVITILVTCIISTLVTERSAQGITLRDKDVANEDRHNDDERILIPVKYPDYAEPLVNMAILMRNPKLGRELVGLNVVYDDQNMAKNQESGRLLLERITKVAAAADVKMQTQVRVAANIANGIKHAFKEFQASEIIIGMHTHKEVSNKFWGQFHQSLYNGLNRQIMMVRLVQPLNTIRRIQVAVPSRAQFEAGFYRWLERLSRMAQNLECRIQFHGRGDTLQLIRQYINNRHPETRADYAEMHHWVGLPKLAGTIADDHLFIVVAARKGTVSYKNALEHLPEEITKFFTGKNIIILFPDQYGDPMDEMTFAQPQHFEDKSAYEHLADWIEKVKKQA